MIITIEGDRGSGKSRLAREIIKSKVCVFIEESNILQPWAFANVNKDTDFIVVDDVTNYSFVKAFFSIAAIMVKGPMKESKYVDMPSVIIIIDKKI